MRLCLYCGRDVVACRCICRQHTEQLQACTACAHDGLVLSAGLEE